MQTPPPTTAENTTERQKFIFSLKDVKDSAKNAGFRTASK